MREAATNVAALFCCRDISAQLSAEHKKSQLYHQRMLLKLPFAFWLVKGYLILKTLDGNFLKLLLLRAEDWTQMIYKREYTSPGINQCNCNNDGPHGLLMHINSSLWFSIIADGATDIN